MVKIPDDVARFIADVQLCYVATVNADNSPNLSPKGSLTAYGGDRLLFANIASPKTVANLVRNPAIEINVVDIFARRGYRFSGRAEIMAEGTAEYAFVADPLWAAHGRQFPVFDVVSVRVAAMETVRSPAYDFGEGVTEDSLRATFAAKYAARQ